MRHQGPLKHTTTGRGEWRHKATNGAFRASNRWPEPRLLLAAARRDVGVALRVHSRAPQPTVRERGLTQRRSWQPIPDEIHTQLLASGAPRFGGWQWSDVPSHGARHIWLPLGDGTGHRVTVGRGLWVLSRGREGPLEAWAAVREPARAGAVARAVLAGRGTEPAPLTEDGSDVSRGTSALLRLGWTRWAESGVQWIDLEDVWAVVCPVHVAGSWLMPPRGILSLS